MRYGLRKMLTSGKFWLVAILVNLIFRICGDWISLRLLNSNFSWKSFWLIFLLQVFFFVTALIFSYKTIYKNKSWLFAEETDFDEVVREVKKNKSLWSKIEAIKEIDSTEFASDYPPRKSILINYKKTHQLKPWEKDYTNWILEFYDEKMEEEKPA